MRVKDANKKEAIFDATIQLLTETGFANLSMSEIGKKAGVSSSTIYVYFKNKEDMLKKVYSMVNEKMSSALCHNIELCSSIRQVIEQLVRNILGFAMEQPAYFFFLEQFANDPVLNVTCEDTAETLKPIYDRFQRGQQEDPIKSTNPAILLTLCYYGTTQIAKYKLKNGLAFSEEEINELVTIWWDAIKA